MKVSFKAYLLAAALLMSFSLAYSQTIRSIDGSFNNTSHPEWGAEGSDLFHLTQPQFSDGISEMNGRDRPNPRYISNRMFAQEENILDGQNLSDFVWVFGQFIDHEIILVDNDHRESLSITIPSDDLIFSPQGAPIFMFRSLASLGSGTSEVNVRTYDNEITAYIDGSAVYGSTEDRANWLRSFEGGRLKMTSDGLMPWNTLSGEFNDPTDGRAPFMDDAQNRGPKHFVGGDARANENPLLATIHTLFVREHNRLADIIAAENPGFSDEEVYQSARRKVGAYIQAITYNEWLPAMGVHLATYTGYRDDVNPQISNVFSAAAFRMGHTLINGNIMRLDEKGEEISGGNITLRDAFFNPTVISLAGGVEPYLRGMAAQVQQHLDCKVIDDVRNFLFGAPGAGGLDLAAININRGRERGLGDFNTIRGDIGLPMIKDFTELASDIEVVALLEELYGTINNIDAWVGMLAEDHMPEAMFGNTIMAIMEDQFQRLRDGDKFFYLNDPAFSEEEISEISGTTMRDIIMRNTGIEIMQRNVFVATDPDDILQGPTLEQVDLNAVAYPNPSQGEVFVKIFADSDYEVDLLIYDNHGRLFSQKSINLSQGDNIIDLDSENLAESSIYNVILRRDIQQTSLRLFRP